MKAQSFKKKWGERLFATGNVAMTAAKLATRRVIGREEGERDGELGDLLAKELDQMKGMAMKVGQILSYFDGVLPEATHQALQKLQQGVTSVGFSEMEEVLVDALGEQWRECFSAFEEEPVASASIGQVYRAAVGSRPVAVKVQYPGVWDTMQSDFSMLRRFSSLASLASSTDGPALVEELRERFGEECDYRLEATHQEGFARRFADDEHIQIPAVERELSSRHVLVMDWCEGLDFYTFVADASEEEKRVLAETMVRFAYQSLFGLCAIQADPHPGNMLFPGDGRIVFLDFGCVRHFSLEQVDVQRRLIDCLLSGAREDFRDIVLASGVVGNEKKFDYDAYWSMLRQQYAPYLVDSFRVDRDYLKAGLEHGHPSNPNLRYMSIPREWIWLQRLQWGLHAVLSKLDVTVGYRSLLLDACGMSSEPLATDIPAD
jgi:predicted unusual protein kinase regulating ubiquinone biosynthesis (AarF/ABC1/UbiB family)